MNSPIRTVTLLAVLALSTSARVALADTPPQSTPPEPRPAATSQSVYGWQLMTPEERLAYRTKMRSLATESERQAFRAEHHELMVARAKDRGISLPETPPAQPARGHGRRAHDGQCCSGRQPGPSGEPVK